MTDPHPNEVGRNWSPAYSLSMAFCIAGAVVTGLVFCAAVIFDAFNHTLSVRIGSLAMVVALQTWPFVVVALTAAMLRRRPFASGIFAVGAALMALSAIFVISRSIQLVGQSEPGSTQHSAAGAISLLDIMPIIHAAAALGWGMMAWICDSLFQRLRLTPTSQAKSAPGAERTAWLAYMPVSLLMMFAGGCLLLWQYTWTSLGGPPPVGTEYWHRLLGNMFPRMMFPMAMVNFGMIEMIGGLIHAARGRSIPVRIGLTVWILLTVVEGVGLAMFVRS